MVGCATSGNRIPRGPWGVGRVGLCHCEQTRGILSRYHACAREVRWLQTSRPPRAIFVFVHPVNGGRFAKGSQIGEFV